VREQEADARPSITNPLASIEPYDTVLLGSPIWNVRSPMIMTTFTESYDFTGKTVHAFVTYAVSGLGSTERDYTASCPPQPWATSRPNWSSSPTTSCSATFGNAPSYPSETAASSPWPPDRGR